MITSYVSQNTTLTTMENIHYSFTGESQEFGRWEQAENKYSEMDWNESSFEEFLRITREQVEGDIDEISEAYIDILSPEDLTANLIIDSLEAHAADENNVGQREGFQYRVRDDNSISAAYYYYTTTVDITEDLEIEELPSQKRIPFEVHPDKRLIIVETTMPAYVGKLKSIINKKTSLEVATTGNLNVVEDRAENIVREFIEKFEREDSHE